MMSWSFVFLYSFGKTPPPPFFLSVCSLPFTFTHRPLFLCFFCVSVICLTSCSPRLVCCNLGCLPVRGTIPDMTSDSDRYIKLQTVYREQAAADVELVTRRVHTLLQELGRVGCQNWSFHIHLFFCHKVLCCPFF